MDFLDRLLTCSDCGTDFVFTAGEQFFFFDKQFKNDPKRCKLCKAKRAGLGRAAGAGPEGVTALPLSRTETRTTCSACGLDTTVPFKPTQGRPVLCRSCFQMKRAPTAVSAVLNSPAQQAAQQGAALEQQLADAAAERAPGSAAGSSGAAATVQAIAEMPCSLLAADGAGVEPWEHAGGDRRRS